MRGSEADLGVIDLALPDGEGVELIEDLREVNPLFAALVLTASLDRTEHARAIEAGAAGGFHKTAEVGEITDATRGPAAGGDPYSPGGGGGDAPPGGGRHDARRGIAALHP